MAMRLLASIRVLIRIGLSFKFPEELALDMFSLSAAG